MMSIAVNRRPTNRPRDGKGRFKIVHGSRALQKQRLRQETYNARNVATARVLFEKLIDAIFLPGERSDWMPAASSSGPVTDLFDNLIKKKFLLSRRERSKCLRETYFNGCTTKKQEDVPKMTVREASHPDGKSYSIHVYKQRRFPVCRKSSEMAVVKDWIRYAMQGDCLKLTSFAEVYEVFRQTFNLYRNVGGKNMYLGFPLVSSPTQERAAVSQDAGDATPPSQNDRFSTVENAPYLPRTNEEVGIETQGRDQLTSSTVDEDIGEENRALVIHASRMLDTAQNDRVFFLLCSIADETAHSLSGIYAACALEKSMTELRTVPLIRDILEYSRGRYFGVKNPEEHIARKHRIDVNVAVLKAARKMYNLPVYEEMNWTTAPEIANRTSTPFVDLTNQSEHELSQLRSRVAVARGLTTS